MSGINAADILQNLQDTAVKLRNNQLSAESGLAIAAVAGRQVDVLKVVVEYMGLLKDDTLVEKSGDVFIGTPSPKALTDGRTGR